MVSEDDGAEVTELTASADGSVHASLDVPLGTEEPDEDPPEPGIDEPGPDVVAGAAEVVKTVAGTLWDVIKPRDD